MRACSASMASTGVVSMVARDFESPADAGANNVYDLSITVTDADGNSDSEAWSVTVQNVVEVASFTIDAIADVNVNENTVYTGVTPCDYRSARLVQCLMPWVVQTLVCLASMAQPVWSA